MRVGRRRIEPDGERRRGHGSRIWAGIGWATVTLACIAALVVRRYFPWIPIAYLAALIGLPTAAILIVRRPSAPAFRPLRWGAGATATLVFIALLPVPWMVAELDDPPGNAWQLDGRVTINGESIDPPGTWYWLTVGRPPTVAEVVKGWFDEDAAPTAMTGGRRASRPAYNEPAAAAAGLRRAGWSLASHVMIEVSDPLDASLPAQAVLASVNDIEVTSRDAWLAVLDQLGGRAAGPGAVNTMTFASGDTYEFRGDALPFERVDVIELPDDLDVTVGGMLADTLPGGWWRNLSVGSSHGLMVALVAYVYGSGVDGSADDLAQGRTIAGTGKILADGAVGAIGGLRAKATAARRVGADVLLFPAQQAAQLADFDAGSMRLVPVTSLDEAIAALAS